MIRPTAVPLIPIVPLVVPLVTTLFAFVAMAVTLAVRAVRTLIDVVGWGIVAFAVEFNERAVSLEKEKLISLGVLVGVLCTCDAGFIRGVEDKTSV